MKTITAPNGKQYEVDEGWEPMATYAYPTDKQLCMKIDGSVSTLAVFDPRGNPDYIAWRPIVPPKEKRWRAEEGGWFWYIGSTGFAHDSRDLRMEKSNAHYDVGNYFRTREEAEASNKAKVMRDPNSEQNK